MRFADGFHHPFNFDVFKAQTIISGAFVTAAVRQNEIVDGIGDVSVPVVDEIDQIF